MDDDEALERAQRFAEWKERTEATLAKADQALLDAERRQAERASPWAEPPDPGQRPDAATCGPVPPLRRPANVPRDWGAEQKWIEQILDRRLSGFWDQIGAALAEVARIEEREHWGPELKKLRAEVAELRSKLQREDGMGHGIQRLEAMVSRLEEVDRRMRRVAGQGDDDDVTDVLLN